ncbi:hypothetical protein M3678_12830, partial [Staphylococcus capitis]|nr:hypothetical protein [Staphylococcus capitis]
MDQLALAVLMRRVRHARRRVGGDDGDLLVARLALECDEEIFQLILIVLFSTTNALYARDRPL